jgi:putative permease
MEPSHRPIDQDAPLSYRGARQLLGLIVLLVIIAFMLHALESVLLLFAIVFLLAMVLNPIVVWLQRHRFPRGLAVALVILGLLVVAATVVLFAIPPLARQVNSLVQNAPHVWDGIRARMDALGEKYPAVRDALPQTDEIVSKMAAAAGTVGNVLLRSTIGFVGGLLSAVLAILLLIFVLTNPEPIVAFYLALAPGRFHDQAKRTLSRLAHQMVMWARGVAINGAITGISIGVLLWLIGVQPALMFGAFAFLGEFLPNIGAWFVAIPILFVALSLGATKFWLACGVIVLVYQVELNFLVPFVLGKEMRLHPANILFFTIAMATSFGILGAILALPAAALVQIVIDEFYIKPRQVDHTAIDREAAALVRHER